jgi:UDP-N-acetylmuramyl pentapeptide phosphotransferase/UDP-N-acetylglucosamine-1-phosphate transferase
MVFLAVAVAALALSVAAIVCASVLARPPAGLVRTNFRGKEIPVVGGLVILAGLLAGEVALALAYLVGHGGRSALTFVSRDHWGLLVVALGFFGVGLLDDLAGGGHARGFRGHVRAIAAGELTGGAIKALGGAAIGLVVGALWEGSLGPALLDAAIIALSANVVNLLDLRPGRAAKTFLIAWAVLAWVAWGSAYVVLSLPVAASTLLWLAPDLGERGMLGDVGANLLGAVLGAGVALSLTVRGRLVVLAVLVVLTAASERWSFSGAIDRVPPLRWLDRAGRLSA